jgi:hypothetical protein
MHAGFKVILVIAALVCFIIATCNIATARPTSAGLACLAGSLLVP